MADVSAGAPAVRCYRFSDGSFSEPTVQMGIAQYRFGGPDHRGSRSDNFFLRGTYDRMVESAGGDYCAAAIGEE